jgi:spore coat polysaccharide biosynthesis protein SpsF
MRKIGIITQARMTSTRLPGKILLSAGGKSVLEHHVQRAGWSGLPVFVATTTNHSDDPVADFCSTYNIRCFRGDEHNVLERFTLCARANELDVVIRVTSDCPLIDGHIIAEGVAQYRSLENDNVYYSNCLKRSYPRGLDFEIFSRQLLEDAYLNATLDSEREHVTPYINQNRSGKVIIAHHVDSDDHSDLRWTLDTTDDWKLLHLLLNDYHAGNLRYRDILKIIEQHTFLSTLNTHIKQKEIKL